QMNRAEPRDTHLHFFARNQWEPRQRTQCCLFFLPTHGSSPVASGNQITHEPPILGTAGKLAVASHAQRLIHSLLEAVMSLLDIPIFMRNPNIVPGGVASRSGPSMPGSVLSTPRASPYGVFGGPLRLNDQCDAVWEPHPIATEHARCLQQVPQNSR